MTVLRKSRTRHSRDAESPQHKRVVIKSWDYVRQRLQKKDPHLLEDEFCVFLEDVPKLIRKEKPKCYFRDLDYLKSGNTDIFYLIGMTSNITRYTIGDNGRFLLHEIIKFPYSMHSLKYVTERNVFVGLNPDRVLVVLSMTRGVPSEMCQVEQLFNALCITTIPETEQVVVGGVGFLKVYSLSEIKITTRDVKPPVIQGRDIETSLLKEEWVIDMKVETFNHSLLVIVDSGIIILNYREWRETNRLTDPGGGTITCCCLDGTNSFLITGSRYGRVKVWSTAIKVVHHQFTGHRDTVTAVACHQKEPVVVTGSMDGWVFIWRLDTLRKFKQIKVGIESVDCLEISAHSDPETVGFWCITDSTIKFYELAEPYRFFASMDSTVVKLKRLLGHDMYPNRILVATWDGGVWFKNPLSSETVGFMYPIITLKIMEKFVYDVIRQRLYIAMPTGSVLVLSCSKTPFRALEQMAPDSPDESVTSIVDVLVSVGSDEYSFETVAIVIGLKNGQIDLMGSDNLHMAHPLQAHHGSVDCLETLTELTVDEQRTCISSRILLSAGSDLCVKVWRLRLQAEEAMGFELHFFNIVQIRFDKVPKYISAVQNRVAVVFTGDTTLEMYDLGKTVLKPTGQLTVTRVQVLTQNQCFSHTHDYDHTDTITALDKCPLLKLFATASMDKTVKIWNDTNALIRELVFEEPVVDICFVTNIGDLMIARDFVLVYSSPEHYLPWYYLSKMMDQNFEKEQRELPKKVTESDRACFPDGGLKGDLIVKLEVAMQNMGFGVLRFIQSSGMHAIHEPSQRIWIDPDRVMKIKRRRSKALSIAPRRQTLADHVIQFENWQMYRKYRASLGEAATLSVPVTVRRRKTRPSFESVPATEVQTAWRLPNYQRYPKMSVSLPPLQDDQLQVKPLRRSVKEKPVHEKGSKRTDLLLPVGDQKDPTDSILELSCSSGLSELSVDSWSASNQSKSPVDLQAASRSQSVAIQPSTTTQSTVLADMMVNTRQAGRLNQAATGSQIGFSSDGKDEWKWPIRVRVRQVGTIGTTPRKSRQSEVAQSVKNPDLTTGDEEPDIEVPSKFDILRLTAWSSPPEDKVQPDETEDLESKTEDEKGSEIRVPEHPVPFFVEVMVQPPSGLCR